MVYVSISERKCLWYLLYQKKLDIYMPILAASAVSGGPDYSSNEKTVELELIQLT